MATPTIFPFGQQHNRTALAFSRLTGAADTLAYFTGAAAMAVTDLSVFARTLLGSATAALFRTTAGLSPTDYIIDVDRTGATDVTADINSAITTLQAAGGGTLRLPRGTYKISGGAVGADGYRTGIYIPPQTYSGFAFGQQNRIKIQGEPGTRLMPGNNDVIVIRVSDQYSIVDGVSFANDGVYTGCIAYAVAPTLLGDTTTRFVTCYNKIRNFAIQGYAEGLVYQVGPTVAAVASNCYENLAEDGEINNGYRGVWFKDGVSGSQGCNRNWVSRLRIGTTVNTGVQVDAADTVTFTGIHLEGINSGTTPNATPTAIKILTNGATSGWESMQVRFIDCIAEACTRDVYCGNDDTQFINCTLDYENKSLFTQTPAIFSGQSYNPASDWFFATAGRIFGSKVSGRSAKFGDALTAFDTLTPGITIEALETGSGGTAVVRAKATASNGTGEFRLDSVGGYSYFTRYVSGTKQWSLGNQANGNTNPAFFDAADAIMLEIRSAGELRPGTVNKLGSAGNVWADVVATKYSDSAGTKLLGTQGAAVADATDAATAITQLNALLARCRTHGLIAT